MSRYTSLYKYKLVTLEKQTCLRKPMKIPLAKPLKPFSFLKKRKRSASVRSAPCKSSQKGVWYFKGGGNKTTLKINIPSLASETSCRDGLLHSQHTKIIAYPPKVYHRNQAYTRQKDGERAFHFKNQSVTVFFRPQKEGFRLFCCEFRFP